MSQYVTLFSLLWHLHAVARADPFTLDFIPAAAELQLESYAESQVWGDVDTRLEAAHEFFRSELELRGEEAFIEQIKNGTLRYEDSADGVEVKILFLQSIPVLRMAKKYRVAPTEHFQVRGDVLILGQSADLIDAGWAYQLYVNGQRFEGNNIYVRTERGPTDEKIFLAPRNIQELSVTLMSVFARMPVRADKISYAILPISMQLATVAVAEFLQTGEFTVPLAKGFVIAGFAMFFGVFPEGTRIVFEEAAGLRRNVALAARTFAFLMLYSMSEGFIKGSIVVDPSAFIASALMVMWDSVSGASSERNRWIIAFRRIGRISSEEMHLLKVGKISLVQASWLNITRDLWYATTNLVPKLLSVSGSVVGLGTYFAVPIAYRIGNYWYLSGVRKKLEAELQSHPTPENEQRLKQFDEVFREVQHAFRILHPRELLPHAAIYLQQMAVGMVNLLLPESQNEGISSSKKTVKPSNGLRANFCRTLF